MQEQTKNNPQKSHAYSKHKWNFTENTYLHMNISKHRPIIHIIIDFMNFQRITLFLFCATQFFKFSSCIYISQ